ncbi:MAG: hypothetical protein GY953_51400, partial [bacterium]|nr:hypothetical protein [bacterium]
HRWVWDGITRQFTRYGNVYREFDSNWDWMHHGEGYVDFYTFGLVVPGDKKFRDRSEGFAAMYIGEDPLAPNYDPEHNIIRAVMNGSRGPKMRWTTRDWIPTNANLVYYHLPYDDIPGVESSTGWINDETFAIIVKTMSDRMATGDVPINLTVTPLIANAWLYTGDEKYKRWVLRYLEGWVERTSANDGVTPDNVGLSGQVGEYTNGNWWGGYYGWKWPRGGLDIVRAELTAAKVALLMTGDAKWLDLPRSQMEVMRREGRVDKGVYLTPARYGQQGWHHYKPEQSYPYVWMWAVTHDERDWRNIERLRSNPGSGDIDWAMYLRGRNPDYPVEAMTADLRFIESRMRMVRNEHGDPETWVDSHWSSRNPVRTAALERLTMGAVPVDLRGEMLHARLRYFRTDGEAGLPADVAALITGMEDQRVDLELVNLSLLEPRSLIVQGGGYGEHLITSVQANGDTTTVDRPYFRVNLEPGAGARLRLHIERYRGAPSYTPTWKEASP